MGEDVDEDIGVGVLQAVPQVLQHGQHDMQDVAHVQRDQDVAEAVPSLRRGMPQCNFTSTMFSWQETNSKSLDMFFSSDSIPKADPSKTDLPPGEYGDGHEVASDAEASNEEGGGQRHVGEPREDCHSRVLV